ncbi:class IV adenylate cyclase [Candidatus Korobacter versatilis]|nr:class IV adenylate cyclase [Candidatus Koribacter versatilis]
MANEVEIKFRIADRKALEESLRANQFREKTASTHELNTLYDFPGSKLRGRGELLRIREFGGKWKVTHKAKGKAGKHKSRKETETSIGDGQKLEEIFEALGLKPSFRYEKFRAEWTDGKGDVVLDHTPVGEFGEIEGEPDWIDHVAKLLGISEDQYITSSYAELFQQFVRSSNRKAANMTFAECGTK